MNPNIYFDWGVHMPQTWSELIESRLNYVNVTFQVNNSYGFSLNPTGKLDVVQNGNVVGYITDFKLSGTGHDVNKTWTQYNYGTTFYKSDGEIVKIKDVLNMNPIALYVTTSLVSGNLKNGFITYVKGNYNESKMIIENKSEITVESSPRNNPRSYRIGRLYPNIWASDPTSRIRHINLDLIFEYR